MLKNLILATTLAALPFAAAAKKPAKAKTAAVKQKQPEVPLAVMIKEINNWSEEEKDAVIREAMASAEADLRQQGRDAEVHLESMQGQEKNMVFSLSYETHFPDARKVYDNLSEELKKEKKWNHSDDFLNEIIEFSASKAMVKNCFDERRLVLRALGINDMIFRIVDNNSKVLAEAQRSLIKDCAAK